jgi:hypothetical protein
MKGISFKHVCRNIPLKNSGRIFLPSVQVAWNLPCILDIHTYHATNPKSPGEVARRLETTHAIPCCVESVYSCSISAFVIRLCFSTSIPTYMQGRVLKKTHHKSTLDYFFSESKK